ncbi:MAG: hypothetical protein IT304_02530 [Dehalococcoidia bacterium]|nr:hypothetical protein [Dehalococcoidia bacterium]
MTELRAESLSPLDAPALWPQLHRLGTEVVATRAADNLLLRAGLAATGITNLARLPHTAVLGLKRGLGYRGILVTRELDGGAGWETVSLRLARDKDDEAVTALLAAAAAEAGRRRGRTLYLRCADGSPHREAIRRAGLMPYRREHLFVPPAAPPPSGETPFRPATRTDRHGVFRLYCRAVPENVRRQEALTQQDWRAVISSYDCEREFVVDREGTVAAWAGFGEREIHVLAEVAVEGLDDALLDLVEQHCPRHGALVLGDDQQSLQHAAAGRGFTPLGVRVLWARRLAALNPLKEVVAVPAESMALPQ